MKVKISSLPLIVSFAIGIGAIAIFMVVHEFSTKSMVHENTRQYYQHFVTEQRELLRLAIYHKDWALLRSWVATESESTEASQALIIAPNFQIIAANQVKNEGELLSEVNIDLLNQITQFDRPSQKMKFMLSNDKQFLEIIIPIDVLVDHKATIYWGYLRVSLAEEIRFANLIFKQNIILYLLTMLLSALVLFYLLKFQLNRRLMLLEDTLNTYINGNHQARVPAQNNNEFKRLYELINMAFNLIEFEEQLLKKEKEFTNLIIESSNDGIFSTDDKGKIQRLNKRAASIFGYDSSSDLHGCNIRQLIPKVHPKTQQANHKSARKRHWNTRLLNKISHENGLKCDGSIVPIAITITETIMDDQPIYIAFVKDVTEQRAYQKSIEKLAFYDNLTQLYNFNGLKESLDGSIFQSEAYSFNLIDIDGLGMINDCFGMDTGDKVIVEFASMLSELALDNIYLARIKAGRFLLLTTSDLKTTEQRLRALLNRVCVIEKTMLKLSFCCCQSMLESIDMFELKKLQSEWAMREAKERGRGSFLAVNIEWIHLMQENAILYQKLESAISENALFFYFQPKFDCNTQQVVSAEALIRWEVNKQFIPPSRFIPLAEQGHLMPELDRFVIENACKTIRMWLDSGFEVLPISINLSARYLFDDSIIAFIFEKVGEYDVPAQLIEVEVTEYGLIDDFEHTALNMRRLQKAGIGIAIDDYGTGHSNLETILSLPIENLKIDQSFIRLGMANRKGRAILENILQLAHSLEVKVTAEGVETKEQLDYLVQAGCHYIQGYYLSHPLSQLDYEALLVKR